MLRIRLPTPVSQPAVIRTPSLTSVSQPTVARTPSPTPVTQSTVMITSSITPVSQPTVIRTPSPTPVTQSTVMITPSLTPVSQPTVIRTPSPTPVTQPTMIRNPALTIISHQWPKEKKRSPSLLIRLKRFLQDTWFNLLALLFYILFHHFNWFVWKFLVCMDSISSMEIVQKISQMIRNPPPTLISKPTVTRTQPPTPIRHRRPKEKKRSPSLLIRLKRFLQDTWFNLLAILFYILFHHFKWFVWKFLVFMDSISSMGIVQKISQIIITPPPMGIVQKKYMSQNVRCTGKKRHKVGSIIFLNS